MRNLYIAIDESGNHSRDECYVVAGCWHVSPRTNPQNVLASTKDKLLQSLQVYRRNRTQFNELKGQAIRPEKLGWLIDELRTIVYEDNSLDYEYTPWQLSIPVGYTISVMNSELFRKGTDGLDGRLTPLELMQVTALSSVLTPLTAGRPLLDLRAIDEIRVIPDASTWDTASEFVESRMNASNMSFETRDSTKTPGIQLTDLAAYAWHRNVTKGDCGTATGLLHDLRFAR